MLAELSVILPGPFAVLCKQKLVEYPAEAVYIHSRSPLTDFLPGALKSPWRPN
jgi:hypothetical protein